CHPNGLSPRIVRQCAPRLPFSEQLLEQPLRFSQALARQRDGFRLADRVRDEALVVKTVHALPVEGFPSPHAIVERQIEQCENRLVDLVGIDCHGDASSTPPNRAATLSYATPHRRWETADDHRGAAACRLAAGV